MKNRLLHITLTIFFLIIIIFVSISNSSNLRKFLKPYMPDKLLLVKDVLLNYDEFSRNYDYQEYMYNVKFLPETQFIDLNLNSKIMKSDKINDFDFSGRTFFLDHIDNFIVVADWEGSFHYTSINNLEAKENIIEFKKIDTNFQSNDFDQLLDIMISNDLLYVSQSYEGDQCYYFRILSAKFDKDFLEFEEVFNSNDCFEDYQSYRSGKIVNYSNENKKGLLFSTVDRLEFEPKNSKSQDESSIYGKINFLNPKTGQYQIFSKGHRNPQGLYYDSENKVILSTEHGPKGGDEINIIKFGFNYGWPESSYGKPYPIDQIDSFYKDHSFLNFEEPIYSFVPSIGISNIIKIPNKFYNNGLNNIFFLTSLNGRSLFLLKFDDNFQKLIFNEKIFIGERIRDIIYIDAIDKFILSFDGESALGIISSKK